MQNNKREEAIKWWNELSEKEQLNFFTEYAQINFTPANMPSQLTGREIEAIYKAEHPEQAEESKEAREMRMAYQTADMQDYENKTGAYAENKEQGTENSPDLLDGITPGEWYVVDNIHIRSNGMPIVNTGVANFLPYSECVSNAKLIAASPKLAAENKELKVQLKKCRNALATSLESNTQTVEMNKREVSALKERIEVLSKALEGLNKVAEMYLTNTEKYPDFKMTAESTITFYFKEVVAKAKNAINQKP